MKAYTYIKKGVFALTDKPKPTILEPNDAIVRTTLSSICSSDLHIKHGSVPRAVLGITLGHEMVGIVEEIGPEVKNVKVGDRVTVNVETFCGECFFCQHGYVNNCTSPHGGWALGCRIDGGQTEYVRVPLATQGLNRIPDGVSDEQALFVGDVLATGFWAARISDISEDAHHRSGPNWHLHITLCYAEAPEAHYRLRTVGRAPRLCAATLSRCSSHEA